VGNQRHNKGTSSSAKNKKPRLGLLQTNLSKDLKALKQLSEKNQNGQDYFVDCFESWETLFPSDPGNIRKTYANLAGYNWGAR
jgi:hypothetical protein